MITLALSDLDRDLGYQQPCDLNVFWALATSRALNKRMNIGMLLRLRYTPGGMVRRTYQQVGARLDVSEARAVRMVSRALRQMRAALSKY